jgi:aminoglycoside 6-adenylyltransferase
MNPAHTPLIERFLSWAQNEENLRFAVIIGSQARTDRPADAYSDLDLMMLLRDPQPLLDSPAWLEQIGEPWLTFIECTGDNLGWERRALFAPGLDVDFAIFPLEMGQALASGDLPAGALDVFRRGYRILLDKENLAQPLTRLFEGLQQTDLPLAHPPSQAEFLQVVNDFWYHVLWSARHLKRGELWWGKSCVDGYLKALLLRMLEWHTWATRPGLDTWLRGRFLEQWAGPRAVLALQSCYAHYHRQDTWCALFATRDLFDWTSHEVALKWGFAYPEHGARQASALAEQVYSEEPQKR